MTHHIVRFKSAALLLLAAFISGKAQTADDLNLQIHGYATQGFLYTTNNNWNLTQSSDGSAAWTEAVVNLSAQPDSKLRIGVQARYFLLGNYGNSITLDWAQADYKFNDRIGIRAGKVKSPIGLYNETQDIDPAHLWVLLPQSVYPITSRNSILAHYGGVVYGAVPLGESYGKLEYRAFGGDRVLGGDDGYFQTYRDAGASLPNGISGPTFGGTLRWLAPVRGLTLGASEAAGGPSGEIVYGPYTGTLSVTRIRELYYFGRLERGRFMLAGEYSRFLAASVVQLTGGPTETFLNDRRPWYAMASYKLSSKLSAGAYYSSTLERKAAFTPARYQKDWTVAARYDFNPFLYAKAEQHWLNGTAQGFAAMDNPNLVPTTRLSLLKLGVSF